MGDNNIRIGIIGCGRVSENHRDAILKCPNAVLAAAGGGRNAATVAKGWGVQELEPHELAVSPDIDAVLVATPHRLHFEYASAALAAGKHVLIEKPVSFDEEQIIKLRRLADESGKVCMPVHSYIYLPELERMKRFVDGGGIGRPVYFYMSEIYVMPDEFLEKYEGPQIDVLCHQLYLLLYYLGVPSGISAFAGSVEPEDGKIGRPSVTVNFSYPNGALAQIVIVWSSDDNTSDPFTCKLKIQGCNGGVHFSRRDYVTNVGGSFEQACYQETFDRVMDFFVNRAILHGEEPPSTIADAQTVCRLQNAAIESIRSGQTIWVRGESL